MPPRRSSVGAGAGLDNPDDPPSGDSDDDYAASRTTPAKGRGSGRARGTRGRGRGAGRARGRGRGGANAARSASKVEDDEEVDELEDDRSDSDSGEASSARAPRPVSPELGVPAAPPEQAENGVPAALVRSSSLSLLSSPASSRASVPPPPQSRLSPAQQEDPNTPVKPQPSPSLLNGSARRTLLGEDGDVAFASPSSVGTVRRPAAAASTHDPTADSLSELDTDISDVDDLAAPASSQEPRASTSASSTPAPLDYDSSTTSAKKKRGRPPGSRNKQHKQPISRAQRAAAAAASVAPAVAPTKVVRNGGASKGGDGAASGSGSGSTPRATRANVTLPPGYIEGVTSSRWPRAQGKGESESAAEGTDGTPMFESGMDDEDELEEEDVKPRLVATPKKADKKGKGRAVVLKDEEEGEEEVDELMDEASTVAMSRETSLDGPPTPVQPPVGKGGPGRPKGKGKRGKKEKVMPEPVERAKRRKLEPDEQAVGRAAAREAARLKFLDQLDDERRLVEERTHPLLGFTYRQLEEEKAQKLAQLRMYQEEREKELERLADTRVRASWRQWSDRKDALRSKLYFENHKSLKDLIAEEKVFPFFREHPLFTNTHDLPPAPHFRGPIRDPSFVPRSLIHAGHYVEPPPLNPVLDHNSWRLSASEIEADLALFFDIDDEPYQAAAAPPAPGPPAGVGMYPYPSPYYYDPAAPPSLVGAYGIPPIPGYPPSGMPPAPYYPPPHHTASGPYGAPPPAHAAPPSAPSSRSAPLREQRAPAPAHQQQQHPAQRSPPVSRKPAPAPPPAASPKTVKPAPVPSSKPAPAPAPVKLPSMNGFSATAPTFPSRPPPAPLPSQGHSSSHPHSSSHSHSHQHSHSHSSAHSHSHSHSHQHHHHRSQSSHTAASPPIPSMSASSSAIPPAQKPTLPSLMAPSFPASSAPRFPSVAGYSVPAAATTATNGHAHTHSHSHSHAHSHSHSQSHSHGQSHPHSRPPSHPPSRSSLPPHAPSPASHTPSAAPAPPTLPSLSQPRISPSLSAPKLPSLTHRSPPGAGPPPSASPPVPGSAPALNLPSLFSGNTAVPGAASLAGSRSPFGLGGMLNGGGGGGGMAPGLSLGFGPATGLPLPSWLNPLPKPSVGVAPSPQGGAGGGEAAAKKQDGGGGVKLPSLNQPPLGQPQHQHQPPRPYWAQ